MNYLWVFDCLYLFLVASSIKSSLGDRIKKMTTVLYKKQRKEDIGLMLDPDEFKKMLEEADSDLAGLLDEMCNILIPQDCSKHNQKEDKKKVVAILYLMAGLRNKHANSFKLELALFLAGSGTSSNAVNALSNAGVSVTYQTVYNYKKKIATKHPSRVKEYFDENVCACCMVSK